MPLVIKEASNIDAPVRESVSAVAAATPVIFLLPVVCVLVYMTHLSLGYRMQCQPLPDGGKLLKQ